MREVAGKLDELERDLMGKLVRLADLPKEESEAVQARASELLKSADAEQRYAGTRLRALSKQS